MLSVPRLDTRDPRLVLVRRYSFVYSLMLDRRFPDFDSVALCNEVALRDRNVLPLCDAHSRPFPRPRAPRSIGDGVGDADFFSSEAAKNL